MKEASILTTDVTHIEWRSDYSVEILEFEDDQDLLEGGWSLKEIPDEYYEMMNHINLNYPEDEDLD